MVAGVGYWLGYVWWFVQVICESMYGRWDRLLVRMCMVVGAGYW